MKLKLQERLIKAIQKIFKCYMLKWHDWTCAASEGLPPTEAQLRGGVEGFWDYATMYCKRCGRKYGRH